MDLQSILNKVVSSANLGGTFNTLQSILNQAKRGTTVNTQNSPKAIEELTLLVSALYELLVQKGLIQSEELQRKLEEIDMRDGVKDGK